MSTPGFQCIGVVKQRFSPFWESRTRGSRRRFWEFCFQSHGSNRDREAELGVREIDVKIVTFVHKDIFVIKLDTNHGRNAQR